MNLGVFPLFAPGKFLNGRRMSEVEGQTTHLLQKFPEALYQDEPQAGNDDDDEERHFRMLMDSLGASNVFEE